MVLAETECGRACVLELRSSCWEAWVWACVNGEGNPKGGRCYLGWRPVCGDLSLLWGLQEGVMVFPIEANCYRNKGTEKGSLVQEWWVCEECAVVTAACKVLGL